MLPEISIAPRMVTNFAALIKPSFKKDLDSYLKNRTPVSFLSELRTNLQVPDSLFHRWFSSDSFFPDSAGCETEDPRSGSLLFTDPDPDGQFFTDSKPWVLCRVTKKNFLPFKEGMSQQKKTISVESITKSSYKSTNINLLFVSV